MKITLTKGQAYLIIGALEWAQNPDYPDSDRWNKMYQRIIDKLNKQLIEEEGAEYENSSN